MAAASNMSSVTTSIRVSQPLLTLPRIQVDRTGGTTSKQHEHEEGREDTKG
jgi:hypothetical protein